MASSSSVDFRVALDDAKVLSESNMRSLEERRFYGRPQKDSGSGSAPGQGLDPRSLGRSVTMAEVNQEKTTLSTSKLGTFDGVFIPTTLNVLSILMFLRFGFILGQAGILGIMFLLLLSYLINLVTTLSISAISTNGTVRGGGAYYMISRSLGPEFGGSIGIVFYIGQVLNTGMNLVGFCDPIISAFGSESGELANFIPESRWYIFLYSSILLVFVTMACTVGSNFFAKSSLVLFVVLIFCTLSVPVSAFFVSPYIDTRYGGAFYTGLSWNTFKDNLMPRFTTGAAGSQSPGKETFQNMFGILFPATSGIFAGASMSGDLRKPSKSISKGTLAGLVVTFVLYVMVILAIGATVSRDLLYRDVSIMQHANVSFYIVLIGELSTSFFSALMGIFGAAKMLQAIAMDNLLKGMSPFAKETKYQNPLQAIALSWALTQATLFFDINEIAVFITMAYLMTFTFTNLACFLLKIASAPNFRPSFKYFNSYTALTGTIASVAAMFVADGISASAMIIVLVSLFLLIHYMSPAKPWGDVSQSLIYHQVRKYLLRLRQDHVKFWRPQILLLVDDPRTSWSLMQFCNYLKKGGLYILGHVIVTNNFRDEWQEIKRQQAAWRSLRDQSGIKGFVQIAAEPNLVWGARNVYMGSGLGGMKPNITVLGFYELTNRYPQYAHRNNHGFKIPSSKLNTETDNLIDVDSFPTDSCRKESSVSVQEWVNIIEDLMTMQATVAVAKGFPKMQFPKEGLHDICADTGFIDLYPIQMSAQITDSSGEMSALTTNFDTYMLILQLGAILHTVPVWKKSHKLRVIAFVEFEEDVESERSRVQQLLDKLRIAAVVKVVCLNTEVGAYQTIVNNSPDSSGRVASLLGNDDWWKELQQTRSEWAGSSKESSQQNPVSSAIVQPQQVSPQIAKIFNAKRRYTMSEFQQMGVSYSIQTNRLLKADLNNASPWSSDDSSSEEVDGEDSDDEGASSGAAEESQPKKLFLRRNSTSQKTSANGANTNSNINTSTSSGTPVPQSPALRPTLARNLSHAGAPLDKNKAKKLKPNFAGQTIKSKDWEATLDAPESSSASIADASTSPDTVAKVKFDERSPLLPRHSSRQASVATSLNSSISGLPATDAITNAPLQSPTGSESDSFLSFNDLPASAQHVILNDMMLSISGESAVIFSTLPAPILGTYKSESDSLEYVENLDLWCRDLPPIMLLNCQTMTVTTAL